MHNHKSLIPVLVVGFTTLILVLKLWFPTPVISLREKMIQRKEELVQCIIRSLGYQDLTKAKKIAKEIVEASEYHNIDPVLVTCLIYTESRFYNRAISKKGYKGLMQTPVITEYDTINIMYGISILKDKLRISNNNLEKAIFMYKGNRRPADVQAREFLKIYYTAKTIFKGVNNNV